MASFEQQEGDRVFEFDLTLVRDIHNKKFGLHQKVFEAAIRKSNILFVDHLIQTLQINALGQEIDQAFARVINQQISLEPSLDDDDILHFNLQSQAFPHAFTADKMTLKKWKQQTQYDQRYMQDMIDIAGKLESQEAFELNGDKFKLEVTIVKKPRT